MKATGIPCATVDLVYHALEENDESKLNALLSLEAHCRGDCPVLCERQSTLIQKKMVYAVEKGFALSNSDVWNIMTQIESDRHPGFRTESAFHLMAPSGISVQ